MPLLSIGWPTMTDSILQIRQLSVHAKTVQLIKQLTLHVERGQCLALLGANGAGKSSLLKALLGLHQTQGEVLIDGQPLQQLSPRERAKRIAYLPQKRDLAWPMAIESVIALGLPFRKDPTAIERVMADCDLMHLKGRSTQHLSGGELARVHIARLFLSGANILLADEPIAELDPLHQHSILQLLKQYAAAGHAVIVALHDIGLACEFADRVAVLSNGQLIAEGEPVSTLTPDILAQTYQIKARLTEIDGHKVLLNEGRLP